MQAESDRYLSPTIRALRYAIDRAGGLLLSSAGAVSSIDQSRAERAIKQLEKRGVVAIIEGVVVPREPWWEYLRSMRQRRRVACGGNSLAYRTRRLINLMADIAARWEDQSDSPIAADQWLAEAHSRWLRVMTEHLTLRDLQMWTNPPLRMKRLKLALQARRPLDTEDLHTLLQLGPGFTYMQQIVEEMPCPQ